MVECLLEAVVLHAGMIDIRVPFGSVEQIRKVDMTRLPVLDISSHLAALGLADHLVLRPITQLRHQLPDFFSNEHEIANHVLRGSFETLPQFLALGRDARRAGIQMADPHEKTTHGDQGRGGKTKFVGA